MFKRIKKLENEINDSKIEIEVLKEKIKVLKEKLYEILDEQKINELSKEYKAKINVRFEYGRYFLEINNHTVIDTHFITDCHEYIQSREFERDIKAFLYKSNKGGIKMASVTQCDVCGNIVKNENSKRVKIYDVDVLGHVCGCLVNKDICLNCYEKMKKILKIK